MVWSGIIKEKLVKYDKATNTSQCYLCKKNLKGKLLGNIKRHYRIIHKYSIDDFPRYPETFTATGKRTAAHNERRIDRADDYNMEDEEEHQQLHEHEQQHFTRAVLKMEKDVDADTFLTKKEFLKCCVGLIAIRHLPLDIFDDTIYLKPLLQQYENKYQLNVNSKTIHEHFSKQVICVRNALKQIIGDTMINLKIDLITSKIADSILLLSVQYNKDDEVAINTLGIIELKKKSQMKPEYLQERISKCLQKYDIQMKQVYSLTLDQGTSDELPMKNVAAVDEEQELKSNDYEMEIDDKCDYDFVYNALKAIFVITECPVRLVHIIALDGFNQVQSKLMECRRITDILRGCSTQFSVLCLPPENDNELTVWKKTYDTIEAMINLRPSIMANKIEFGIDFKINWKFYEQYIQAFTPFVDFTKQFQNEQYIIGDFYRDWMLCEVKLKKLEKDNEYAMKLLDSMRSNKCNLLDNFAFVSAIYMDPRFNFTETPYITNEQKKTAVFSILKTNNILGTIVEERGVVKTEFQTETTMNRTNNDNDEYSILEEELMILTSQISQPEELNINISQKLDNLAYEQRIHFATDILKYWKNLSTRENDLYQLAKIILLAPVSQASVKRTVNAISTIMSKQNHNLSMDQLRNILMVNLNENLL